VYLKVYMPEFGVHFGTGIVIMRHVGIQESPGLPFLSFHPEITILGL